MSDYTKAVDFAAKDAAEDTFLGAEHNTEFTAIETAIATKANKISPETNRVLSMDSDGDIQNSGIPTDEIGRLIDVKVYDTSGSHTWTKPSGCKKVEVEMVGAGAGGGGIFRASVTAGIYSGSAGGAGAYVWARFDADDLGSTESVSVGAKGSGGVSPPLAEPTAGGNSTFGSHITANGGSAGANSQASTPQAGGGGGTSTVSSDVEQEIRIDGGSGDQGGEFGSGSGAARNPKGGSSVLGHSHNTLVCVSGVTGSGGATNSDMPGAGGMGSIKYTTGGPILSNGADGSDGIVIVKSYS